MTTLSAEALSQYVQGRVRTLHTINVPALAEARASWRLHTSIPSYVMGAEGAVCDAGVVLTQDDGLEHLGHSQTARLFHSLAQFEGQDCVLSIDFKTINPATTLMVGLTRRQWEYNALLVIESTWSPNLAAVISARMLLKVWPAGRKKASVRFLTTQLLDNDPIESFPTQLGYCLVPTERVADCILQWVEFHRHPGAGWRNPYTGTIFKDMPRPILAPINVLKPDPMSRTDDLEDEEWMWNAFKDHGSKCRLERLMIKPGVGDFQIVYTDRSRQTRIVVEMKRKVCLIMADNSIRHRTFMGFGNSQTVATSASWFSPLQTWDFLLSTTTLDSTQRALFVSRDSLPDEWFRSSNARVSWAPGQQFMDNHLLPWRDSENGSKDFVRGVERILAERVSQGQPLNATKEHKFVTPSSLQIEMLLGDKQPQDPIDTKYFGDKGASYLRYDQTVRTAIRQQCLERNRGWIYQTPYHPTGSHVYVPIRWAGGPPRFQDLSPLTPCVCLNFGSLDWVGEAEPHVDYWPHFYRAVLGDPSVYMLFPYGEALMGKGLDCYMVPSVRLDGDGTIKRGVDAIFQGSFAAGARPKHGNRLVRLEDDEMLTTYAVREADIAQYLDIACRKWCGSPPQHATTSYPPIVLGKSFLDGVVRSKAKIDQDYFDMQFPKTPRDKELADMLTRLSRQYNVRSQGQDDIAEPEDDV